MIYSSKIKEVFLISNNLSKMQILLQIYTWTFFSKEIDFYS